jgi:acetyl-CoA synthetase
MEFKPIQKDPGSWSVAPNLINYPETYANFSWDQIYRELEGLPGGGINIAYEAVDRHANGSKRNKLALRWLGKDGEVMDFTYGDLKDQTNRFANVLREFGIQKGERVAVLAGRIPALYVAALGTLKNASVFCPLFSAFGPEPIYQRLFRGDARILVTTQQQYKKKIVEIWDRLPQLKLVLLSDIQDDLKENVLSLPKLMAKASPEFSIPPTDPEDMSCLHFTSGTTGMPKGAIHVHKAVYVHYMTARYALDLHPDDIFWCTADPGWVTGTSYGVIAPLLMALRISSTKPNSTQSAGTGFCKIKR